MVEAFFRAASNRCWIGFAILTSIVVIANLVALPLASGDSAQPVARCAVVFLAFLVMHNEFGQAMEYRKAGIDCDSVDRRLENVNFDDLDQFMPYLAIMQLQRDNLAVVLAGFKLSVIRPTTGNWTTLDIRRSNDRQD